MNINKHNWILYIFIFCTAFGLRIYNVDNLFPFTMDEEYQAFLAQNMIQTGHIPLIGVNVADTGLYLGSFFTWLSAVLLWLGGLQMWMVAAAVIGGLTAVGVVWVVQLIVTSKKIIKDTKSSVISHQSSVIAVAAGLLYAVNPLIAMYDHKYWNPSLVMFLTVVWLGAMVLIRNGEKSSGLQPAPFIKGMQKYVPSVLLGVVFGMALHTHYSVFMLLPVTVFAVGYWIWKDRNIECRMPNVADKRNKKLHSTFYILYSQKLQLLFVSIATFIFFLLPLIVFDLRHKWLQGKALISFLFDRGVVETRLIASLQSTGEILFIYFQSLDRLLWLGWHKDIANEIVNCSELIKSHPSLPIGLILFVVAGWLWWKKIFRYEVGLIMGVFATAFISLFAYQGEIAEYYFLPLFVLGIVLLGLGCAQLLSSSKKQVASSKQSRKEKRENKNESNVEYKIQHIGVVVIFGCLLVVWLSQALTLQNHLGLSKKIGLLTKAQEVIGDRPYHLEAVGQCYRYEGYRYLAESIGFIPTSSYMDGFFGWIYGEPEQNNMKYELIIGAKGDTVGLGKIEGSRGEYSQLEYIIANVNKKF